MNTILDNARIAEDVQVGEYSIIGKATRPRLDCSQRRIVYSDNEGRQETIIQPGCYIGSHVVIEEGVQIGHNCIVESKCVIEMGTTIGPNTIVVHSARILPHVVILNNCVIGGLIADRSKIGQHSRILGSLLHSQKDPHPPWDNNIEKAPAIGDNVFVGFKAMVIGNVKICDHVYICAGAVVTRDVPSFSIVKNTNEIMRREDWPGTLRESTFWEVQE